MYNMLKLGLSIEDDVVEDYIDLEEDDIDVEEEFPNITQPSGNITECIPCPKELDDVKETKMEELD